MNILKRLGFYLLAGFIGLAAVYGVARIIQVSLGSHYDADRGPYLQMPAQTAMTIRWQTTVKATGKVKYGTSPTQLDQLQAEKQAGEYHEIRLTGLKPGTRYYYALEPKPATSTTANNWFVTAPDSATPTRFWVLGDPGYANPIQDRVRDAMLAWSKNHPRGERAYLDLMLTTGDNAYTSGRNEDFQYGFFLPYQTILRNIPVWPVYGNHDARRWAFFKLFSLPEQAQSGGVPSGTENYYSFDYSNIHFVVLDSHASSRRTTGEMANWLRKDLAANKQTWLIALFHHPPYTRGSHDSDDLGDSRGRMADMRENFLPILEKAGVDLVFSGHSHVYERSYFVDCHYGTSKTLQPDMLRDKSVRGPYLKQSLQTAPHEGAVYLVVGSSSKVDYATLDHPVMAVAKREAGSMIVDVDGFLLTARFINQHGKVTDEFSIEKGIDEAPAGNLQCRG